MSVKIAKLLADFQATNPVAKFDKEGQAGGSRKYGYASYNSVIDCLKPLAAKGMCWMHKVGGEVNADGTHSLTVSTYLMYEGESVSTTISRPMMPNIQALGSEITYLKRYQLVAMCGITADEDDDGASANDLQGSTPAKAPVRPPRQPAAPAEKPSEAFAAAMTALNKADTARKRQEFLATAATRVKQGKLTTAEYSKLSDRLVGMIQDPDELSTNMSALFQVALEDNVISDAEAGRLQSLVNLRVGQLNGAAAIGGRLKS